MKIMVPHIFARRINIAQYGPDPFLVQEIVMDGAGLKRYRVGGQLFLRHELVKVRDAQRVAPVPPELESDPPSRVAEVRGRGTAREPLDIPVVKFAIKTERLRSRQGRVVRVERVGQRSAP